MLSLVISWRFDGAALGIGKNAQFPPTDPLLAKWATLHADAVMKGHNAVIAACGMSGTAARTAWLRGYQTGLTGAMEAT